MQMSTATGLPTEDLPNSPHARQLRAGFPWLTFDGELEAEFRRRNFDENLLHTRVNLCLAILIVIAAIDTVVLLTLTQRLYIFDVLKFGKELGAISQFARIFLESGAGKIVGVLSIFGLVLIACLFAPRPRRLKEALVLALLGVISIAFGSWRDSDYRRPSPRRVNPSC